MDASQPTYLNNTKAPLMNTSNMTRMSAHEISPAPRPYEERSVNNLLYLKASLEQEGELVPVDLLAALSSKGVIV